MKILSIGNFTTGWDNSICDEAHIAGALERLGHEVFRQQRDDLMLSPSASSNFDFILVAQWAGYGDKLDRLAKFRCPVVYWAFDYQADGQAWHERLVEGADLYLSKRLADSKYPNWQWLPQDFAPEFLGEDYYSDFGKRDIDVLFTGSYLPWATERTELLKAIDKAFNLTVHSVTPDAWKAEGLRQVKGPVMDKELPKLIHQAKVNISIDHTIEAGYWSDRNAQIMACGGFVLTRYVPLMETVFRDNVAYFYNTEDCLRQIRNYLGDNFKREYIAEVGKAYARQNLMVTNRVKDLLTIVGQLL